MWIYKIPHQRPGWRGIDRESCKFTGFPNRGQAGGVSTGNHVNLQDSLTRGQAGGVLTGNRVNLQDSPPEARLVGGTDRKSCEFTWLPTRGQAVGVLTGNHVNLQDALTRGQLLVGYQQGIMWIYKIPHQRPGWRGIDRESCKFTGFPNRGQAGGVSTGNHVNLQDSLTRGQAGGVLTGNRVNLQDSPPEARLVGGTDRKSCEFTWLPTRGQAGGVLTGNHVNLQDALTRGQLLEYRRGIM